jgi:hypothetical protein
MSEAVMAILHWEADPDTALERYETAVAMWRETFGDLSAGPLHAIAGRSERGGLVVVNVFPTDGDHLAFGRNMGDPLTAVGLPTPDVEHVSVHRLGWPESVDGEEAGVTAARGV